MATSGMRWPHRSPDELRAFYSIAIRSGKTGAPALSQPEEARSILAPTWSTSDSIRPHYIPSSIFSCDAWTGSSGTSFSDKIIVTLAPKTSYEETTGLSSLNYITRSSQSPASLFSNGVTQSEQGLRGVSGKRRWRTDVPRLARSYDQDEANEQFAKDDQATPAATEPALEEKFWLDTLQEHPYYDIEQQTKLGRIGTWKVKRRRRGLRVERPKTQKTNVNECDDGVDPIDTELLEKSLDSDEESVHIVDNFLEDDRFSLMGSFESRFKRRRSGIVESDHPHRTLLLDLIGSQSLRHPIESDYFSIEPSATSLASTLELFSCADVESFHIQSSLSTRRLTQPISYYCLPCFQKFDHNDDCEEHEYPQHVALQRDWICMPWGAIQTLPNGDDICVFCGFVNPNSSHGLRHNEEPCSRKSTSHRIFQRKEDFETHARDFHGQQVLTEQMEQWSFSFKDEDWYWQCGFCERVLVGWDDRSRHIGRHFRDGFSIVAWDPLVSCFPINRSTGVAACWTSQEDMNRKRSEAVRCRQADLREISYLEAIDLTSCNYCIVFDDEDNVRRHEQLYHLPRDVWRCPTNNDARTAAHLQTGPLATFLFPDSSYSMESNSDVCPYCCEYSDNIFNDLDEDVYECSADWEVRMRHLKEEHNFDQCSTGILFIRPEQFLLHLVGSHNHQLSRWTKEIMDSCKRGNFVFD